MVARCWRTCRKANCMSNSGNVVLSVSYYIIPWEQVIVRLRFRSFISSKKHHHCTVDIQPANEGCSPTPWGAGRTLPTVNHWLKATSLLILLSSHLLSESRRSFSGSTSHCSKARHTNPYLSSLLSSHPPLADPFLPFDISCSHMVTCTLFPLSISSSLP